MDNCIFCKIIKGEIPSYKIYEDDLVYAFLDISQTTYGHTLMVPKEHVMDIFQYDETLAGKVLSRLPKVAKALEAALPDMEGLNILSNNKELAYQTVFHSHWHLIPRFKDSNLDGFSVNFTNRMGNVSSQEMEDRAEKIRKHL